MSKSKPRKGSRHEAAQVVAALDAAVGLDRAAELLGVERSRGRRRGVTETPERMAVNLRLPAGGTAAIQAAAERAGIPVASWMRRVLLAATERPAR